MIMCFLEKEKPDECHEMKKENDKRKVKQNKTMNYSGSSTIMHKRHFI